MRTPRTKLKTMVARLRISANLDFRDMEESRGGMPPSCTGGIAYAAHAVTAR
jgi:hypothetical protein